MTELAARGADSAPARSEDATASAPEAESTQVEAGTEVGVETETETEAEVDAEAGTEAEAEVGAEVGAEVDEAGAEAGVEVGVEAEVDAEVEVDAEPGTGAEVGAEVVAAVPAQEVGGAAGVEAVAAIPTQAEPAAEVSATAVGSTATESKAAVAGAGSTTAKPTAAAEKSGSATARPTAAENGSAATAAAGAGAEAATRGAGGVVSIPAQGGAAAATSGGAPGAVSADAARGARRIRVPSLRVAGAVYAIALLALWLSPMGHHWNHVDIYVYRQGGLAVLHGQGLYVPSFNNSQLPFTYPPISALLFTGLGFLSNYTAPLFATLCSVTLLPLTLRFALRLQPFSRWLSPSEATRLGLTAAAAALWFEPLWTTLRYGQINVLIAALILFDLSRSSDRRWKGVAIGIAAGLKMTPLIFIVYLAATRRYRAAAMALAGFVGTIALSFAVLPTDARIYWTQDVLNANRPGKIENAANQTLRGALSRLLHTENVQGAWFVAALIVAVVGIFLAVRTYRRDGDEAGGFALCALTGLLVSPISWTHHWVEAIPALMLVMVKAYRNRSTLLLIGCILAAAVGYSQITWRVPVSNFTQTVELHENGVQLLCSNAYVIAGVVALAWAAVGAWVMAARTKAKAKGRTTGATVTAEATATAAAGLNARSY